MAGVDATGTALSKANACIIPNLFFSKAWAPNIVCEGDLWKSSFCAMECLTDVNFSKEEVGDDIFAAVSKEIEF